MKSIKYFFLVVLMSSSYVCAYEEGWDYQNFYGEVDWCKQSIIYPSAQDYIKTGSKAGKAEDDLRSEAISMIPVFEKLATEMCYCTFNELAKDIPFPRYQRGEIVKQYMAIPRCQSATKLAMEKAKINPGKDQLK